MVGFTTGLLTTLAMVLTYIVRIRSRFAMVVRENFGLVNDMQEGLIVKRYADDRVLFSTRPARKIFQDQNKKGDGEESARPDTPNKAPWRQLTSEDFARKLFAPVQFDIDENVSKAIVP